MGCGSFWGSLWGFWGFLNICGILCLGKGFIIGLGWRDIGDVGFKVCWEFCLVRLFVLGKDFCEIEGVFVWVCEVVK